jgi:inhibitor of KinA sporulation pathway (predicted exonuclease)
MNYTKIVLFDLEMCCWKDTKKIGEIIEIGLVVVDLKTKTIVKKGQYYVKPEKDDISDFCTDLTKITSHVIKKQGRPLKEVLATIQKNFGGKKTIYGAWGRDDSVLNNECHGKNINILFDEFINVAALYRMKKNETGNRVSLTEALNNESIEFEGNAHSGLVDAYNLAKLFIHFF